MKTFSHEILIFILYFYTTPKTNGCIAETFKKKINLDRVFIFKVEQLHAVFLFSFFFFFLESQGKQRQGSFIVIKAEKCVDVLSIERRQMHLRYEG